MLFVLHSQRILSVCIPTPCNTFLQLPHTHFHLRQPSIVPSILLIPHGEFQFLSQITMTQTFQINPKGFPVRIDDILNVLAAIYDVPSRYTVGRIGVFFAEFKIRIDGAKSEESRFNVL